LVADYTNIEMIKIVGRTISMIKIFKTTKERNCRRIPNKMKGKIPNHEIRTVEEEWKQFKDTLVTAGEDICG
jgi:hypothetical protein